MIIKLTKATGIRKYTGLMFRTKNARPLVFEFDKPVSIPIHSWFCPKFYAVWELEDGSRETLLVDSWKSKIAPSKPYTKLFEIPVKCLKEKEE